MGKISFHNTINVVTDIETESEQPNSAIVSIGLVKFGLTTEEGRLIFDSHYCEVNPESNSPLTHMSHGTQEWWKDQNKPSGLTPIITALQQVNAFCENADFLWGHGASFDNVILYQNMLMHCVTPTRVIADFRDWSDTRTYFRAADFDFNAFKDANIADSDRHHAANDAMVEAKAIIETYFKLQLRGK